ncbi:MAG: 4-(cytidine 5'-diphospho)-2-C-methyl-D-erythritol kinase [Thermodesulfobacteriota bacterium]
MLRSPAKINLFLAVHGKRGDGYHELTSLMSCVGLHDKIELIFEGEGLRAICSDPSLPTDERNLAVQAAARYFEQIGLSNVGLTICIEKHIPVGAGLGGGSSNAATVLRGVDRAMGHLLGTDRLSMIAETLGSDVPFFIRQIPSLAQGRGERLTPYPHLSPYPLVLVNPGFQVSTAWVYGRLKMGLTNCAQKLKNFPFKNQPYDPLCMLCNDLEAVTETAYPDISAIKELLCSQGAIGALMSGSGPTVFGVFGDRQAALKAFEAVQRHHKPKWRCWLTDLIVEPPADGV